MTPALTAPMAQALQRAIADGSLPGQTLHAMLVGPSPVSPAATRRATSALDPALVPGLWPDPAGR